MLSERRTSNLYDALSAFESCFRARTAYPVHKTLRFEERPAFDVYDWIVDRFGPSNGGTVVDAGCGVGFGTLRIAERTTCRVTGISVSAREIELAREAARRRGVDGSLEFRCASFEALPATSYDLAVAVESLKHSLDLPRSIAALLRSLKPAGTLVIVEDLAVPGRASPYAGRITADWHLARLYGEADYLAALGSECRVEDLTAGVRPAGRLAVGARLAAIALVLPFVPRRAAEALRAFRGGLYLERLYAAGAMTYKAIVCRSPAAG